MSRRLKILHLVPSHAAHPDYRYLGSTKDFANRWQYFADRNLPHEVVFHAKAAGNAIEGVRQLPMKEFTHVVIEKAIYPAFIRYLRTLNPRPKLIYRSHNAELPHRLDYIRSSWRTGKGQLQSLKTGAIYVSRELASLPKLDAVWSISSAEMGLYWRLMGLRVDAQFVPFFLPRAYRKEIPALQPKTHRICLCMTSSHPGAVSREIVRGFFARLEKERESLKGWKFVVTATPEARDIPIPKVLASFVEYAFYDSPYDGLVQARAVAMLSEAGRGFKTKLLESVLCGAALVVTKEIYRRLPGPIQARSKIVGEETGALAAALREIGSEMPALEDVNESLGRQAYQQMDVSLGLAEAPGKSPSSLSSFLRTKLEGASA